MILLILIYISHRKKKRVFPIPYVTMMFQALIEVYGRSKSYMIFSSNEEKEPCSLTHMHGLLLFVG